MASVSLEKAQALRLYIDAAIDLENRGKETQAAAAWRACAEIVGQVAFSFRRGIRRRAMGLDRAIIEKAVSALDSQAVHLAAAGHS